MQTKSNAFDNVETYLKFQAKIAISTLNRSNNCYRSDCWFNSTLEFRQNKYIIRERCLSVWRVLSRKKKTHIRGNNSATRTYIFEDQQLIWPLGIFGVARE